ncbi:MAG: Protein kinase [Watsoniomyces obsoletus]|nr:MAG: Protein kinase [Watsoniomyces obsoletus]
MAPAFDDEELSFPMAFGSPRHDTDGQARDRPGQAPSSSSAQPASMQPPVRASQQQRLGQYTIIRTLGEGSFGKVKLAVHQVSGQKVALKIISRRKLINRDMAGRVEREIQYLQLLRHPHIIKLYTVITTPGEIIMVLEYAGGELFEYIVSHGRMTEDSARRFFQQMICAVEYCHRHKIVHRDLKPENLLLDEQLNVKIADFGLSNIMTDGNFLKTSCGSPNYAAPEVISGKLYAGPEVDVWSCGVILYVLVCGGLPFDDEYIPTLFKKIGQGNYTIPSHVSPGAASLIRRMLVVNSVQRITVQEIRQDPWFTKNLAPYLQPPVEEFLDTGVDPNKAINPKSLAPGRSPALQEKLHQDVVGKLGKTMGYAKDDVQDALGKDEPSAIKDAYLIVRENQLMKNTPLQPSAASTPPTDGAIPIPPGSPPRDRASVRRDRARERMRDSPLAESSLAGTPEDGETVPYQSSIGILPSSMTAYHRAYMAQKDKDPAAATAATATPNANGTVSSTGPPSEAERATLVQKLKPHSRKSTSVDRDVPKPEGFTPVPAKKPRQTKWQFGIRSRNPPLDAMYCIYRALQRLGAEWEDPEMEKEAKETGGDADDEAHFSGDERGEGKDRERRDQAADGKTSSARPDGEEDQDSDEHYMPRDPWLIRCRWLKDGLAQPGSGQAGSGASSTAHPASPDPERKESGGGGPAPKTDQVYVYMDIQLYQIEQDFYLVDFKCAGYKRLLEEAVEMEDGVDVDESSALTADDLESLKDKHDLRSREGSAAGVRHLRRIQDKLKRTRGLRRQLEQEEEKVSSPFPFLDLASKLIIALAEGD